MAAEKGHVDVATALLVNDADPNKVKTLGIFQNSEVLRRFPAVFDPLKCISSSLQNDGLQTPMLVCTLETFS
jgi:hypothetical protein